MKDQDSCFNLRYSGALRSKNRFDSSLLVTRIILREIAHILLNFYRGNPSREEFCLSPGPGTCIWSPTGKARGTSMEYPPTPVSAEALRCASTEASAGYPPVAKSAVA